MYKNSKAENTVKKSKIKSILNVLFIFAEYYFVMKQSVSIAVLLLVNDIYISLRWSYIDSIYSKENNEKLKKQLPIICFDAIFNIVVFVVFLVQAIKIDVNIWLVVIISLAKIVIIISTFVLIGCVIATIELSYSTIDIISKEEILDAIKNIKISHINKNHCVIILNKVLPENINEQQKEELDQFFIEILKNSTIYSLVEDNHFVGQYSDDQFIICFNNSTRICWKEFFENFDYYNDTKTEQSLNKLTTFDHEELKARGGAIVPYTYTYAYKSAKSKKYVTLKQLFKKACEGTNIK